MGVTVLEEQVCEFWHKGGASERIPFECHLDSSFFTSAKHHCLVFSYKKTKKDQKSKELEDLLAFNFIKKHYVGRRVCL